MSDIWQTLLEETQAGLRIVEAHICRQNPPEVRAELRGRELAYRVHVDQLKKALCQHDRAGQATHIEAMLHHLEAVERLLADVEAKGYKAEFSKGMCGDSVTATKRAIVGLWNYTKE